MNDVQTSVIARRFRNGTLAATAALAALVTWWFLEDGVSAVRVLLAAVFTAPLWLMMPRLAAANRRGYATMTLIVVPYFVLAITEAVANPQLRTWAAMCLFVSFTLFVALIAYLRVTRPANVASAS